MERNDSSWLPAIALAAYLCLPSLTGILAIGKSSETFEKHPLAQFPDFPDELGIALTYPRALDAYIQDNFGLKRHLAFVPALKYRFVEGAVVNSVLIGKEGWLFYSGDDSIARHRGLRCLSDDQVQALASRLAALRAATEAHGGKFVFGVAPDKQSIYPEYLPSWAQRVGPCSVYDQAELAARKSGVAFADLRQALLAAKADQVYHRTDTHWNDRGASIAAAAILAKSGVELNQDDLPKPASGVHTGDLVLMLNMPELREQAPRYPLAASRPVQRSASPGKFSVLVIGDSFSDFLMPFFEFASASPPHWMSVTSKDAAKAIKADHPSIVVLELAERKLGLH